MSDFEFEIKNGAVTITEYKGISKNIVIPAEIHDKPVTVIGVEALRVKPWKPGRNPLTSVVIPGSVTMIGNQAFENNQLISVSIPDSVTTIGRFAFNDNCLKSIVIPKGIAMIEDQAFSLNQLVDVKIPAGVTEIGCLAFWRNLLGNIDIPDSVATIGHGAFLDNPLIFIRIGSGVNLGIRENSFANNFDDYYKSIGKRAGIYTFDGSNWKTQG